MKQLDKKSREIVVIAEEQYPIYRPTPAPRRATLSPLTLWTLAAAVLFMLAFSGVEVGHVLAYVAPLCIAVLAANEIYKRWGFWYSIWTVSLGVVLFAVGFGDTYMRHMISLFASVQKISLGGLFVSAVLFAVSLKKR